VWKGEEVGWKRGIVGVEGGRGREAEKT